MSTVTKKKSTSKVTTKLSAVDKELIEGYVGLAIIGQLDKGNALRPAAYNDLVAFSKKQKMEHLSTLLESMNKVVKLAQYNNHNEDTELN